MNSSSDLQLIHATLKGDLSAYDELVHRHQDRLVHSLEHSIGSREDALDIAQQAFILAWKNLASFRGDAGFYSWLYRIARNAAVSQIRKPKLDSGSLEHLQDSSGYEPQDLHPETTPEHSMIQAEQTEMVRIALQEIAEEFRQPLVLKEIDGFSYEEIAEIMDIPLGTVRSRIFRGRQELISRLQRAVKKDE